jgi:cell division protein ZapA
MDSAGSDKQPVRVTIFNQTYTLRASGDPQEIKDLAGFVDNLMDGIASKTGDAEAAHVAVLACLHLADRLRTIELELTELKKRVEEKSSQYSLLLEQALEGGERFSPRR